MTLKTLLQGCVLWLEFRELNGSTVYDLSTQNNHGTIYGAERKGQAYGKTLTFDGVDDYVKVPEKPSLDIRSAITLEARFKTWKTNRWQGIVSKPHTNPTTPWNMYSIKMYPDLTLTFSLSIGGSEKRLNITTPLNENVWYHAVGTYDGFNMKIYVDGKLNNSQPQTGLIDTNNIDVYIAKLFGAMFKGVLATVKIYNRALTPKEIQTRYQYPTWAPKLVVV